MLHNVNFDLLKPEKEKFEYNIFSPTNHDNCYYKYQNQIN